MQIILLFMVLVVWSVKSSEQKCQPRVYGFDSIVCVCNATFCDGTDPPDQISSSRFLVYTSTQSGLRFRRTVGTFVSPVEFINTIRIDRETKYQQVVGWGGAFTDSTGINIASLSKTAQSLLIQSYFSPKGIEYNLCRVPIGGTDFSTRGYSYDDGDEDIHLNRFALAPEDYKYKIPLIKEALRLRRGDLKLLASAWSPPAWMKVGDSLDGFMGILKFPLYQVWADYHKKFLEKYKDEGIHIWAITTGNEPTTAFVKIAVINRLGWTPDLQETWIKNYLGPIIKGNFPEIKILALDDQRYLLPWWAKFVINNNTNQYIDGVAVHWYTDNYFTADILSKVHDLWPDKIILSTEASIQLRLPHVALGSWARAEKYSYDIIQDCSNWAGGWIDWNMALNLDGGPTYENNYLDAAIIVNASSDEFYKQPLYYHIGHFSKFVPPGSTRIFLELSPQDLYAIAFERPDNGVAIIILNKSEKIIPISVNDPTNGVAKIGVSAKSITTIVYW